MLKVKTVKKRLIKTLYVLKLLTFTFACYCWYYFINIITRSFLKFDILMAKSVGQFPSTLPLDTSSSDGFPLGQVPPHYKKFNPYRSINETTKIEMCEHDL